MRRKKVVWSKNPDTGHVEQKGQRPRQYIPDVELPEEVMTKLTPHLLKGALWRVASPWLSDIHEPAGYELPPHPYAHGTDWRPFAKFVFEQGNLAIYMGTTRVEESKHGGQMVSIPRHAFMINGSVFMVRRLTDLEPII